MTLKFKYSLGFMICFFLWQNLLGQSLDFSQEKKLVLDTGSNDEYAFPLLSNDGKTLYYVKSFSQDNIGGKKGGQDIWFSERTDSSDWSYAQNLGQLNNRHNNMVVGSSDDDTTLYLLNSYSSANRWRYGLSTTKLINDSSWSNPKELDIEFPLGKSFRNFHVSTDENLILLSTEVEPTKGLEDIFLYYKQDSAWIGPIHLDSAINSIGSEISPFYSAKWDAIFFASDGRGGYGSFDIFMSFRVGDNWNQWTPAINLGSSVNSKSFEAYLSTYSSGESYFVSSMDGRKANIYTGKLSYTPQEPKPTFDVNTVVYDTSAITLVVDNIPEVEPEYYVVQVLAMPFGKEPEKGFFKLLENKDIDISEGKDGLVRYHFGDYKLFKDAVSAMKKIRAIGYSDAFVRAIMKYAEL